MTIESKFTCLYSRHYGHFDIATVEFSVNLLVVFLTIAAVYGAVQVFYVVRTRAMRSLAARWSFRYVGPLPPWATSARCSSNKTGIAAPQPLHTDGAKPMKAGYGKAGKQKTLSNFPTATTTTNYNYYGIRILRARSLTDKVANAIGSGTRRSTSLLLPLARPLYTLLSSTIDEPFPKKSAFIWDGTTTPHGISSPQTTSALPYA
jgi:hypothetical protein